MALDALMCNHLAPLGFKGLNMHIGRGVCAENAAKASVKSEENVEEKVDSLEMTVSSDSLQMTVSSDVSMSFTTSCEGDDVVSSTSDVFAGDYEGLPCSFSN